MHDDAEALIEEARRRARRRRLVYAAVAAVLAVAVAGGAVAIVLVTGKGGGAASKLPAGFTYVQARGPVQHAVVELFPSRTESIGLATGNTRPARSTWEVWYDGVSGLERGVVRIDGRVLLDQVGQALCPGKKFCIAPEPFSYHQLGITWPLDPKVARVVGQGTFKGRDVIWVKPRPVPGSNVTETYGLDPRTHQVVVHRESFRLRGHRFSEERLYTWLKELPARSVAFAVPKGGATQNSFPPSPTSSTQSRPSSLSAASGVLGRTPLWLGRRFQGHRLRRVEVGTEGMSGETGRILLRVKFARLDYGAFKLQEFGGRDPGGTSTARGPGT